MFKGEVHVTMHTAFVVSALHVLCEVKHLQR